MYISKRENLLLVGNPGTGQTHLATALGFAACSQGKRVRFMTTMFGLVLAVFVDTPTGKPNGPPSASFPRAVRLHPSGVRLRSARYARLRCASPRRGEAGGKKNKLQKQVYTSHAPVVCPPPHPQ